MTGVVDKDSRDEPRPTRLEALLDDPPDPHPLRSFAEEMEALWAAIDALRDPQRSALDLFGTLDFLEPQRLAHRIHDPLGAAGVQWRCGRMIMPRSEAEHLALRRKGDFGELAKDCWRSLLYGKKDRVDWFVENYMRLFRSRKPGEERDDQDIRDALFEVLSRQWADKPARLVHTDPPGWLNPASTNPKGHLYTTVVMDAHKLWVKRAKAESPKAHKPLDELTPSEEEVHLSERAFATKELLREQLEGEMAEYGLAPREAEVARLVFQEKSNAEIAAELGIKASTVREHRKNITAKVERGAAC